MTDTSTTADTSTSTPSAGDEFRRVEMASATLEPASTGDHGDSSPKIRRAVHPAGKQITIRFNVRDAATAEVRHGIKKLLEG